MLFPLLQGVFICSEQTLDNPITRTGGNVSLISVLVTGTEGPSLQQSTKLFHPKIIQVDLQEQKHYCT